MHEDFTIVYKETVMNMKLQFERPISSAEIIPVGRTFLSMTSHESVTGFRLQQILPSSRVKPDSMNVIVK